ncbi:MAG: hypothetical protein IJ231_01360 [Clostridia bacterium]|nr:hypothetical protein [Clostridia bacterium]
MYMNWGMGPRGPMYGGYGPMRGRGFGPMDHRPRGCYRRPVGFFPMGGLLILPAVMFGGWIALAVLGGILGLVGSIIGGIFEGLGALASGAFSGGGLAVGIVIGLAAYYVIRNRKAKDMEE